MLQGAGAGYMVHGTWFKVPTCKLPTAYCLLQHPVLGYRDYQPHSSCFSLDLTKLATVSRCTFKIRPIALYEIFRSRSLRISFSCPESFVRADLLPFGR